MQLPIETDTCSVNNCNEVSTQCAQDEMCKPLFDAWREKCSNLTNPQLNLSERPMCTDDCKQALNELWSSRYGHKLRCCACGRLTQTDIELLRRDPPTVHRPETPPNRIGNMTRPRPPRQRSTMRPTTMPSMMPSMTPNMMPGMMPMLNATPSAAMQCHVTRLRFDRFCGFNNDVCTDCKQTGMCIATHCTVMVQIVFPVCPKSCSKVIEKCMDDAKCNETWVNYYTNCEEVISWNGNRSAQPTCSMECKGWLNKLMANPISKSLRCCMCDATDREKRTKCTSQKRNIERLCNMRMNSSDECQRNARECNNERRGESSVDRTSM